jgi:hypothetical protein
MPLARLAVFLLAAAALAFGQLDSDTLTITATHQASLQPDELVFLVSVSTAVSNTLDEVLTALQSLGITAANFSGLISPPAPILFSPAFSQTFTPPLLWQFTTTAPFSKLKATVQSLSTLQQTIAKKNPGWTLAYGIQGAQVSRQLQDSQQCPTTDLVTAAQAQAQKVASVAALTVGPVLAIADAPSTVGFISAVQPPIPYRFVSTGAIVSVPVLLPTPGFASGLLGYGQPISSTPVCSITVKFKLLRYQ